MAEASKLRDVFKLEAVDITGGEPTIYPDIGGLVKHCADIGLKPTIITNGLLTGRIAGLIESYGLEDVLLSIHGFQDRHSEAVSKPMAWTQVGLTIETLIGRKFPFRTNTTLTGFCVPDLDRLAKFFVQIKPRIVNFISFNPHPGTKWSEKNGVVFQLKHSDVAPKLREAIAILDEAGIWVNVRYFPMCLLKGFEGHVCGFRQWQYDPYEWEYFSAYGTMTSQLAELDKQATNERAFGDSVEERVLNMFASRVVASSMFGEKCQRCAARVICDGLYPQYVRNFGTDEVQPYEGEPIRDPLFFREPFRDRWGG